MNIASLGEALISVAEKITQEILSSCDAIQLKNLCVHFEKSTTVPPEYDRVLIARVSAGMSDKKFNGDEKRTIRGVFVTVVRAKASS